MFSLFQTVKQNYTGESAFYGLHDFERKLLEDHKKVVSYYRTHGFFIPNEHLLVRLISTVSTPLAYDDLRYYEVTQARALHVARTLRITSSINTGSWWKNVFLQGCYELIIAYDGDEARPTELLKDWRNLQPVKFLDHPLSNFGMAIPDGRRRQTEEGLAVIGIDIPMLMMQYRGFMLEQMLRNETENKAIETTKQFVAKYVLPNMLKSQLDIALMNRVVCQFYGQPYGKVTVPHAFPISDYSMMFDAVAKQVIHKFKDNSFPYEAVLAQLPKLFSDYPLLMPDIANTRQVWWSLFLSRVKIMMFLLDFGGKKGRTVNGKEITEIKVIARQFRSSGEFNQAMPNNYDVIARNFLHSVMEL